MTIDRGRGRSRGPELSLSLVALVLVSSFLVSCSADRGIETPRPLFVDSPVEYPLELWDQDIEGSTLVRVLVSEQGAVDSVMVLESSGRAAFDSAAVRGAKAMEFKPALKKGQPVRVWARVPVHFSKKKRPPPDAQPLAAGGP